MDTILISVKLRTIGNRYIGVATNNCLISGNTKSKIIEKLGIIFKQIKIRVTQSITSIIL